jgi:transposase
VAHLGREIWPTNQTKPDSFVSAGSIQPEGSNRLDWKTKVELFETIRREYVEGVGTIQGVARKLGVHRRMVREAIHNAIPAQRKKIEREPTRLVAEVAMFIHSVLEQDQQAPPKQRHTAQRVFERVREEMPQQEVSARSVRRAVQQWKQEKQQARAETYISQQYEAGREAQVDWYEAYAEIAGERKKLQVLCVRSMYSGAAFHRAYERATQLAFLDAQARAFEMFGGVFTTLRYDNLKSAVKQILRGKRREESTRFIAFRSHYLFDAEFCTPAKGNEKGGVEQENGRFRRRWWTPVPRFSSLDDLNQYLLESCIRDRERRIDGRANTVNEMFAQEQSKLRKRPDEEFDRSDAIRCKVDAQACVRVKHNRYSTPLLPGTEVDVRVDASHVEVRWKGEVIARHVRCYQVQQEILLLDHYLGVLERKPGALPHSKALAQYRQAGLWPVSFDQFLRKLIDRHGTSSGTREMIRLLRQVPEHGTPALRRAIEAALECGSSDGATVLHLLAPMTKAEHSVIAISGSGDHFERPLPTLNIYDTLLNSNPVEARS